MGTLQDDRREDKKMGGEKIYCSIKIMKKLHIYATRRGTDEYKSIWMIKNKEKNIGCSFKVPVFVSLYPTSIYNPSSSNIVILFCSLCTRLPSGAYTYIQIKPLNLQGAIVIGRKDISRGEELWRTRGNLPFSHCV